MIFEIELRKESETRRHRVELPANAATEGCRGQDRLVLDGKPLEADWEVIAPSTYSILLGGHSYEARVAPAPGNHPDSISAWVVTVAAYDFYLETRDPRKRRYSAQTTAQEGPQDIRAPMPGKVVRILVAPGAEVARDQGLLVIEAMKMQNELRAPRSGRVAELHVREGMGIETGSRLIRLE